MRKLRVIVLSFLISHCLFSPWACATEEGAVASQHLSLKQAINMALENSEKVKIQRETADKAWEQRDYAEDNVTFKPTDSENAQAVARFTALLQANLNYEVERKDIENKIDEVTLAVIDKYYTIKNLQEKVASLQQALHYAEWNKKLSWTRLHVGVMAPSEVPGIDASLQQAKSQLQSAEEELVKAYTELNILTGMKPEDRPELLDSISYEPLKLYADIEYDIYRAVQNSVDVWKALQNVTIQREDLSFLSKPYDVEKHDIDIAELSVTQAKEELRKQVRLLYHDIKALEEAIKAAEDGIKAAEEALRVAEVNYDTGMATKADVLQATKELASARQQLTELKCNHAVAVANYRNFIGKEIVPGM